MFAFCTLNSYNFPRAEANYYPVFDTLGGVIYLRDANGNNVNSYTYDEWGRILTKTEGVYNPIRYASYWYDDFTNLYHLGARWYDPTLYRFISVDPHPGDQDDSLSLNEYLYCRNNPLIYTDPDGDYATAIVLGGVIVGAGTVSLLFWGALTLGAAAGIGYGIYRYYTRPQRNCNYNSSGQVYFEWMFRDQSDDQIRKGIESHKDQIARHKKMLKNPKEYAKDPNKSIKIAKKDWKRDIKKHKGEIKKKQKELKKRARANKYGCGV